MTTDSDNPDDDGRAGKRKRGQQPRTGKITRRQGSGSMPAADAPADPAALGGVTRRKTPSQTGSKTLSWSGKPLDFIEQAEAEGQDPEPEAAPARESKAPEPPKRGGTQIWVRPPVGSTARGSDSDKKGRRIPSGTYSISTRGQGAPDHLVDRIGPEPGARSKSRTDNRAAGGTPPPAASPAKKKATAQQTIIGSPASFLEQGRGTDSARQPRDRAFAKTQPNRQGSQPSAKSTQMWSPGQVPVGGGGARDERPARKGPSGRYGAVPKPGVTTDGFTGGDDGGAGIVIEPAGPPSDPFAGAFEKLPDAPPEPQAQPAPAANAVPDPFADLGPPPEPAAASAEPEPEPQPAQRSGPNMQSALAAAGIDIQPGAAPEPEPDAGIHIDTRSREAEPPHDAGIAIEAPGFAAPDPFAAPPPDTAGASLVGDGLHDVDSSYMKATQRGFTRDGRADRKGGQSMALYLGIGVAVGLIALVMILVLGD